MEPCTGLRGDLKAYLDGELNLSRRLRVRIHLARCARCSTEVAAMERIGEELRKGDQVELDAALRYRILAHAAEAFPPAVPARHAAISPRRLLAIGGAVAAAMLAVFISYRAVLRSPAELMEDARMALAPSPPAEIGPAMESVAPGAAPHGGPQAMSAEPTPADGRAPATLRGKRPNTAPRATRTGSPDNAAGAATAHGAHAGSADFLPAAAPRRAEPRNKGSDAIDAMSGAAGASSDAKRGNVLAAEAAAPPARIAQAAQPTGTPQGPETRNLAANLQVTHVMEVTLEVESLKDRCVPLERLAVSISGAEPGREVTGDPEKAPEVTYRILVPADRVEEVLAGLKQIGSVTTLTRAGSETANTQRMAETQAMLGAAAQGSEAQQKPADLLESPLRRAAPSAKVRGAQTGEQTREPGKTIERPALRASVAPSDRPDALAAQQSAAPPPASTTATQSAPAAQQRTAQTTPPVGQAQDQRNRTQAGGTRASAGRRQTAEQTPGRLALVTVHVQAKATGKPTQQAPAHAPVPKQGQGR